MPIVTPRRTRGVAEISEIKAELARLSLANM
jgi:hypothetical protein